tara:strand:+ start:2079 stop:2504 length:426 start_codon:yes stop_codon:yes gene_type:complete
MKLTIVADDKLVSKDGNAIGNLPLKDFPKDVWAVQWDGSKGTVEKRDFSLTDITDITPYNPWIAEYDKALADAAKVDDADWEVIGRSNRDALLSQSDWVVLPDSPITGDKLTEWKTYRQALRDLPAKTTDWKAIEYPTQPS